MDGIAAASRLMTLDEARACGVVRFEIASPQHDASLRRLLRENPMPGQISLSLEREPSYFAAAAIEGPEHQTVIGIEGERVICVGSISARQRFINGVPMRVGYLGGLRVDASYHGRAAIIRRGYDFFRRLHEQGGPSIYLTSIIADNIAARRLLERNLKGMPTYRFLGEFVTLIIRRRQRREINKLMELVHRRLCEAGLHLREGSDKQITDIAELLQREQSQYQFAPVWAADELQPENFRVVYSGDDRPVACAAMWDQRSIKQTVVRGYAPHLRWLRPVINLGAAVLRRPRLPRIGQPISYAFVSHLAASSLQPQITEWLMLLLQSQTEARGIDYLTVGFDARDPRLAHLRKVFWPREYVSRLYAVHWEDGAELAQSLDARLLAPEVALL